jgi:hypothetical protein
MPVLSEGQTDISSTLIFFSDSRISGNVITFIEKWIFLLIQVMEISHIKQFRLPEWE